MLEWLVILGLVVVSFRLRGRLQALELQVAELSLGRRFADDMTGFEPQMGEVDASPFADPVGDTMTRADWDIEPPTESLLEPELEPEPGAPLAAPSDHAPEPASDSGVEEVASPGNFSFEELFGRRLPIWAGGITLAVAGVLIVKLSIEAGFLSPTVRVICGALFGLLLIAGAEIAYRFEEKVRDVRVRQALAGAGVASLYSSCLMAANMYQLIGPVPAMLGMAAVTALALFLSIRFGAPSALLGLVGGLSAPALIGSDNPNVPLLSLYLALAVGGLCALSRSQKWAWLGVSALVGGFGWGLLLVLGGALDVSGSVSVAVLLLLLGVGFPAMTLAGGLNDQLRLGASVIAAAQMAALVATGGFTMLNWGLFALISVAMIWLANREPMLRPAPAIGTIITLGLLAAWPEAPPRSFAIVLGGALLIYGAPAHRRLWSPAGSLIEGGQIAALTVGGFLIALLQFQDLSRSSHAIGYLALGLAGIAGTSGMLGWNNPGRREDGRFALLASAAAFLLCASASLLFVDWTIALAVTIVGLGVLLLGQRAHDRRLEPVGWIIALIGVGLLEFVAVLDDAFTGDKNSLPLMAEAAVVGLLAGRGTFRPAKMIAQFVAPLLFYQGIYPHVPDAAEPALAGAALVGLAWWASRMRDERLVPAMLATVLIMVGWALEPLAQWFASALLSVAGQPVLVSGVPGVKTVLTRFLAPALLIAIAVNVPRNRFRDMERWAAFALAGMFALVGTHSLYKQLFDIASRHDFVSHGVAERLVWEIALLAAGAGLLKLRRREFALVPLALATAHWLFYGLLLHNPLWSEQAVGGLPVLNLIVPLYAFALPVLAVLKRDEQLRALAPRRGLAVAEMLLILLFSASLLRQMFHGSILTVHGLSQVEDIARSILAIGLAIGFLLWGIARNNRDWRIGSLVLMLCAVCKVFLWDASGLEGLLRIASFVALGFSLIGIGWLYSRSLRRTDPLTSSR
jgi:uncharacterized membrane protein